MKRDISEMERSKRVRKDGVVERGYEWTGKWETAATSGGLWK